MKLKIDPTTERIIIRPAKTKEPCWLVFSNKEEKTEYLKKEARYCAISKDAYMTAKPKDNKTKMREFLDKRVAFAAMSGFVPHPQNYQYWFFTPGTGKKRLA